jgi:hypothetical protein
MAIDGSTSAAPVLHRRCRPSAGSRTRARGGGFFDVNSAHPLENLGALSNMIQTWAILVNPAAFRVLYGHPAPHPKLHHLRGR